MKRGWIAGSLVVAAYVVACSLDAQPTAEPGIVVTVLNPKELPAGAKLWVYAETPSGWIVDRQLQPLASPRSPSPSPSPAPGPSLMERRREDPPSPAPAMAGSDHAHSGSSRETGASPSPSAPPPETARVLSLGAIRLRISVGAATGRIEPEPGVAHFAAPLPPPVQGGGFDGAVVLEAGSRHENVRFHAP